MVRTVIRIIGMLVYTGGVIGLFTLPEDVPVAVRRLGKLAMLFDRENLLILLFGISSTAFAWLMLSPLLAHPYLKRLLRRGWCEAEIATEFDYQRQETRVVARLTFFKKVTNAKLAIEREALHGWDDKSPYWQKVSGCMAFEGEGFNKGDRREVVISRRGLDSNSPVVFQADTIDMGNRLLRPKQKITLRVTSNRGAYSLAKIVTYAPYAASYVFDVDAAPA